MKPLAAQLSSQRGHWSYGAGQIRFYWRLSANGDPASLAIWEPDHVLEIRPATAP